MNALHEPPPQLGARVLAGGTAARDYTVRLADSPADVRAAQALRFAVFNLERGEGLAASHATRLDADPFDAVCDHLLIELADSRQVVGTYRLQTGERAARGLGYYSAQEFDCRPFAPFRAKVVELGRACVHKDHRSRGVLGLLWKGIADYARERDGRYLIGCSSLPTQDVHEGAALYAAIARRFLAPPKFQTRPWPAWACPLGMTMVQPPRPPRLLGAYLSLGARICGAPAIDREFKTIDFLTVLDLAALPPGVLERLSC